MNTAASRAWKSILAFAPALALACADPATAPESPSFAIEAGSDFAEGALTLVSDRAFNSLAKSSRDDRGSEGWNVTEYKSSRNLQIVSVTGAPRSPSNVAQMTFPAGLSGGSEPARAKREFDIKARTISIDLWNKVSSNWQGPRRAASVIFTINVDGRKRLAFEAQGTGKGKLTPAVSLWGAPDSRDELKPNVISGAEVVRGEWQHWRVSVRANTVGQKDGLVEVSLNGEKVLSYSNVELVSRSADWFDEMDWKPKWGGGGDRVSSSMSMQWDHVTIAASDKRAEAGSGSAPAPLEPGDGSDDETPSDGSGGSDGSDDGKSDDGSDDSDGEPEPDPTPTVASVAVSPGSASAEVGESQQFSATARDASGKTMGDAVFTWKSTNTSVATVTSSGLASARAAGAALIIATSGAFADTARFTVTAPPVDEVVVPGAPTSGYFVSPSGRSGNSGTMSSPWDLATALSGAGGKIRPGDTIWVRGGTYPNGGRMTAGGSSSANVTLSGYPGETAIIKRQFRSSASYTTITNLVFEGPIDGNTNQVYLHDLHHVTFTKNVIRNGDYHAGLSVDESHHMIITHNYIHDNGRSNQHDHGIYFKTTTGTGNVIANNLLVRNAARGLSLHDNSGPGVYDVTVAHNTVVGNGSTGILVNDGDRITLVNNIAMNNGDGRDQDQIRVIAGNSNNVLNNLTWHSSATSRRGIENTTSSRMSGNKVADPMFRSYLSDLRLQSGSPAIGMGLSGYSFGTDYSGASRSGSIAVGAYQYR